MDKKYGKPIPEEVEKELQEFYDNELYSHDAILGLPTYSGFYRHKESNRLVPIYSSVFKEDRLMYFYHLNHNAEMNFVDIDEYTKEADITDVEYISQ